MTSLEEAESVLFDVLCDWELLSLQAPGAALEERAAHVLVFGRITELEAKLATARADALEEAARHVLKARGTLGSVNLAEEILALISTPPEPRFTLAQVEAAYCAADTDESGYAHGVHWVDLSAALTGEK